MRRGWALVAVLAACGADGHGAAVPGGYENGSRFEPPVLTNAEPPVRYPPAVYSERVEGTTVLRLFATREGAIVPESTRIAEGSGNRLLDSAALDAVARMRFAPARINGQPTATAFLQPVQFRHPAGRPSGTTQ